MKKFLKWFTLAAIALVLVACGNSASTEEDSSATAEGDKVIRVGATGQSFPNSYQEDGELTGFDVEVFNTVAANLGYEVEWTTGGFDGLVTQLNTGKLDTIANNFAATEERAEIYQFTTPYAYAHTALGVQADSDIQTIEDLEGQTIGGVAGSNKVDIITNYIEENGLDIEIRTYENREGPELDLNKGQVQAYVQDYAIIQAGITLKDLPFRTLEQTFSDDQVVFPFAQNDEGTALKEAFDAELENLRNDGTLAELSEKYYGEDITQE